VSADRGARERDEALHELPQLFLDRVVLELAVPTYRFVERSLRRSAPALPLALKQVDPLIRQLTLYRDAIERLRELRTALISAAVTGKIDVREEVA